MADNTPESANTGDLEFINLAIETLKQRAAEFAAEQAYKAERMRLIDVPMVQLQRDELAYKASVTAADNAYRDRKFDQVDLPMLQLAFQQEGRAGLQQMLDGRLREYGLKLEGEKVEDMMNRTALAAAELQMQDALSRDKMAALEIPGLKLDATRVQQAGLSAALDDYYRNARMNGIDVPEEQRKYIETGMTGMQQAASISAQYAQMGLTAQQIEAQLKRQGLEGYQAVASNAVEYAKMGQNADQIQDQLMNTALKGFIASGELAAKYAAMGLDAQTVQNATQQLGMQSIQMSMQDNIAVAGVQTGQADLALKAAGQADQTAIEALKLAASLQGPKNAFQQQQVMWGLNQQGLSRGVDAIAGKYDLPTTQANQANPESIGLGSLGQDITNAGGQTTGVTGSDIAMNIANQYSDRGLGGWNPNDAANKALLNYGTGMLDAKVAAPVAPGDVQAGLMGIAQQAREFVASRPNMDPALKAQMLALADSQANASVAAPDPNASAALQQLMETANAAANTNIGQIDANEGLQNQLARSSQTAADIGAAATPVDTGAYARQMSQQAGQNALNNEMPIFGDNSDIETQLQQQIDANKVAAEKAIGNVGTSPTPPITAPSTPAPTTPGPSTPGQPVVPKNLDNVEALSAIWDGRPDLQQFFISKGWDVTQPEQKAAAVAEWGKLACAAGDPAWVAAGGDAILVMQQNNWKPNPAIWQPVRALENIGARLGQPFVDWVSGDKGGNEPNPENNARQGGKGQALWGPDWRWQTATPAQKWQLQRMWVNDTADGISFGRDPIYALRELGGIGGEQTPWMTQATLMQNGRPLRSVPTNYEAAQFFGQKWLIEGQNPQMKAGMIAAGDLPPNPTLEQATQAFLKWYKWQAGMTGIYFSPGQEFKLIATAEQMQWTPPAQRSIGPGLPLPPEPAPEAPPATGPNTPVGAIPGGDGSGAQAPIALPGQTPATPATVLASSTNVPESTTALPQFGTQTTPPPTTPVIGTGATVATPTTTAPSAQPAAFLPSASAQASTLPGGTSGAPTFGDVNAFTGPTPEELAAAELKRQQEEAANAATAQPALTA